MKETPKKTIPEKKIVQIIEDAHSSSVSIGDVIKGKANYSS